MFLKRLEEGLRKRPRWRTSVFQPGLGELSTGILNAETKRERSKSNGRRKKRRSPPKMSI